MILQRLIEIWGSLPELYLLIIFASLFTPSPVAAAGLAVAVWLDGPIRLCARQFLRNRQMEYVLAARALGLSNSAIMWRHPAQQPHPVITFALPHLRRHPALTSLDFLGLGRAASTPSLGELLAQGKDNPRRLVDFAIHLWVLVGTLGY